MGRFSFWVFCLLSFWIVLQPAGALCGEVRLKNGDRLTGRLVKFEGGKLTLAADYAGDIQVDWAQVDCLATERVHTFRFSDKTVLRGIAECPQQGTIRVRDPETGGVRTLALADLEAINPPPGVRYKGNLTAGGSASSGNTESQAYYGAGRVEVRSKKHRLTLSAKGNYAESDDTATAQNAAGTGKYDYFLTQKLFAYAQTLVEQDRLQDLNLRTAYGAGLGYQFFDTERLSLYAEAGASHVNEDYEDTEDRSFASGRWSVGFQWQIVPDRVRFFHFQEGYVSLEDTEDFYIRTEQGLQLPLIDNFFCNIQVDYDYNNRPAPDKKKEELRYLIGLGYSFSN
jgi:putative salt-induced outer membrane protein YdiY